MSRENDCVTRYHMHVGQCQRAGYANGRADALDEVEEAIQLLVDEESWRGYEIGPGLNTALNALEGLR